MTTPNKSYLGAGGMGLPQRVLANSNFPFPNTMSNNMGLNSNFHLTLQQNQSSRPQPISPSRLILYLILVRSIFFILVTVGSNK